MKLTKQEWDSLEHKVRSVQEELNDIRAAHGKDIVDAPVTMRSAFAHMEFELEKWREILAP